MRDHPNPNPYSRTLLFGALATLALTAALAGRALLPFARGMRGGVKGNR